MRWTNEHDTIFLREVLIHEPLKQKHGSHEQGNIWRKIAKSLNGLSTTGISPEEREGDIALVGITERFEEADEMHKKETDEEMCKK